MWCVCCAPFDPNGCSTADNDGDGVPDGCDALRNTPAGAVVSEEGCSMVTLRIEVDPSNASQDICYLGDMVRVDAPSPCPGYRFDHWAGDVPSGHEWDDRLWLTMDGDKTLRAVFLSIYPTLSLTVVGPGRVVDANGNELAELQSFDYGTEVTLTAIPDGICDEFIAWTGDVESAASEITITMNENQNLQAAFQPGEWIPTCGGGFCTPAIAMCLAGLALLKLMYVGTTASRRNRVDRAR